VRAAVLAVVAAAIAASAPEAVAAPADPPCFGAAVRAYVNPCRDHRLRFMVRPRPAVAQITPNAPCTRLEAFGPVHPCAFGVPPEQATDTIALIGDSHAAHWRAAVEVAARANGWFGLSAMSIVCPVTTAIRRLPEPELGACLRWNRAILRWLHRRPQIHTVFQSQLVTRWDVARRPGESRYEAEVRGYLEVWDAFPRTVRRVVVIRDNPRQRTGTPACVMRARAQRRRPLIACAEPRAEALWPDPLAAAARRARSRRVDLVDLTHFMCGRARCFPVVGGALVHKDTTHLTQVFARTLGPFLLRRLKGFEAPSSSVARAGAGARRRHPRPRRSSAPRARPARAAAG
jgi:hypothetical protein